MINKVAVCCFVCLVYAIMWSLHVDYITSAGGHPLLFGMHICSGAYANNVKCMYTRVPVHIVDCSGYIGGI